MIDDFILSKSTLTRHVILIGFVLTICTGCPNVTYKTTIKKTLQCGGYVRRIEWELTEPAPETGYIVQKITRMNSITLRNFCKERTPNQTTLVFWEAWPVDKESKTPSSPITHDEWFRPDNSQRKGEWRQVSWPMFIPWTVMEQGLC